MLAKVRGLIAEHRARPDFHTSEKNPAYLKLVFMEQGLAARLQEAEQVIAVDMNDPKTKTALDKAAKGQNLNPDEQKVVAAVATMKKEAARHRATGNRKVMESEVQEAQVVLAAQDMVDRIQDNIEEVSEMQFKDLPALVSSMQGEIGTQEASQFNETVTQTLATLLQALQTAKGQLESSLGVITGQQPTGLPAAAADVDAGATDELAAATGDQDQEDLDLDLDAEEEVEEPKSDEKALGRTRRA